MYNLLKKENIPFTYDMHYANAYIKTKWEQASLSTSANADVYKTLLDVDLALNYSEKEFYLMNCCVYAPYIPFLKVILY